MAVAEWYEGKAGRKSPLGGRAKQDDIIYFVETGGDMVVTHRAIIKSVLETEKMSKEESVEFVDNHQKELNLSKKQYERQNNMDDWIITGDINKIKA